MSTGLYLAICFGTLVIIFAMTGALLFNLSWVVT